MVIFLTKYNNVQTLFFKPEKICFISQLEPSCCVFQSLGKIYMTRSDMYAKTLQINFPLSWRYYDTSFLKFVCG